MKANGLGSMRRVLALGFAILGGWSSATAEQETAFFRIVSPAGSAIKALSPGGMLTWTNATTISVTCTVQRATTLAGAGNWADYVLRKVTNATMVVRVYDAKPPAGMVFIPEGDVLFNDMLDEDMGQYLASLSYLEAFFMDQYEVTWSKWQEVRTWAVSHGYDLAGVGGGKGEQHPVHSVNFFDAAKWCNARSEKEGLAPYYYEEPYYSAPYATNVFRTGEPFSEWVAKLTSRSGATGYRLPSIEAWEKAARGGLSARRFPWGNTITHSQANYYSTTNYPYDASVSKGYHPLYDEGAEPFTSPVGSFVPNGFGLYDICGNVRELSGSFYWGMGGWGRTYSIYAGGSWKQNASLCRMAFAYDFSGQHARETDLGFRCIRPAR